MHQLVEEYIEKVKRDVLMKLDLYEKEFYPVVFKSQLDRSRFPQRTEYTANVLNMMTAYKRLTDYKGSEEEYEKLCNDYWLSEVIEDGDDYILFKRYKNAPVKITDDEFWKLMQYAKIDPDGSLNYAKEIIEKLDSLSDAVEELSGLIEQ